MWLHVSTYLLEKIFSAYHTKYRDYRQAINNSPGTVLLRIETLLN
uniref:Uncharacterized protein n=1 Tax=Anguilla anguilla TaxID=7936 RepID=A0A0E9S6B9_ANGAN